MYSNKVLRGRKIEPLALDECPSSFLQTHNQLRSEDRGAYKLKMRNEKIQAELGELAANGDNKLIVTRVGNRLFLIVKNTGITVSLAS